MTPTQAAITDANGQKLSGIARRDEVLRLRHREQLPVPLIAQLLGTSVAVIGRDLRSATCGPKTTPLEVSQAKIDRDRQRPPRPTVDCEARDAMIAAGLIMPADETVTTQG